MHFKKVPRKTTKQYRQYSPTAMTNAYKACLERNVPVLRASVEYGVPQNTLRQRVKGRVDPETLFSGPSPLLSQEEEAVFVNHLKSMAELGYGYTRAEVVDLASNYAFYLNKRDKDHPFSLKWFRCFMKRWPELGINKPRSLSNYRARATSQSAVDSYFEKLNETMEQYDLKEKPENVYNVDEKGIQTEHTPPYVVSASKNTPAITSSRSAITTILACGNALGTQIPPYFIFKGARMRGELLEGSSAGAVGTVTESGWSNSSVFQDFLETHFLKYIQRRNEDQPVLLLFDGHKSHINISVMDWAKAHNIILFVLPAHTSHILQPLDVGCFGPLQRVYNSECHKFMRENPSSNVTRYNVASLACKAYVSGLSAVNLKSAFKRTGIYPFDPDVIDVQQLAPSTVYNTSNDVLGTEADDVTDDIENNANDDSRPGDFCVSQQQLITNKMNFEEKKKRKETVSGVPVSELILSSSSVPNVNKGKGKSLTKKSSGKRKSTTSVQVSEVNTCNDKPGPSGDKSSKNISFSTSSDSDDMDVEDDEKCCVCGQFQPAELKSCVSLIFTKWAQCDKEACKHWTHLIYCCKQRVVRRHDKFYCPCHSEE